MMPHPQTLSDLALARQQELLAEVDRIRRVAEARAGRRGHGLGRVGQVWRPRLVPALVYLRRAVAAVFA